MLNEESKNRANMYFPFPIPFAIPDSKCLSHDWFLHTWR